MKILLIVPPFNFLKEGYGTKTKIKRGNLPNLGLFYIAACLEKASHSIKIIDAQANGYTSKEIIKIAKEFNPEIIGISITSAHYLSSKELIPLLKKEINIPIICGGPEITCFAEKILKEINEIDICVIGEGELTIVELVNAIQKKQKLNAIKGIAYRDKNQKIKFNEKRETIINLDTLPMPSWHLIDFKLYSPLPDQYKRLPAISMVTSRGCTWQKCTFCFESGINAKIYRRHSPERVIAEIKLLQQKYGIKEIDFLDDEFLINEKWIGKFTEILKNEKINLSWSAYGRVDHITKKILEDVKSAGCWSIFLGIESGNQDLLDKIKKGITIEQIKQVCKWANELGIDVRGSFMLGLPGETPEKAMNTINFAIELQLATAAFHLTYPDYGTELYDIALKEGKIVKNWTKRTTATYIPNGYKDGKELEKMQKIAFKKFYFRPKYILKRIFKIRSFGDVKKNIEGLKFLLGII